MLEKAKGGHSLSLGYVGLYDSVYETGESGPTNSFLDNGVDLQYQWDSAPADRNEDGSAFRRGS